MLLSTDRIAARKLIYLLSAFLPGKASHGTPDVRSPSRTSSINYLSQSPPNFTAAGITSTPGSRFGSLRRKARKKPSKLNMAVSSETDEADDGPDSLAGWAFPAESNTSSSAVSVLQLPLGPGCSRNCESTGTLTTLPSSATCAASAPAGLRRMSVRPSSSGSVASVILKSTLKRTGAANTSMESGTTWGSFLSFWGNPKSRSSSNSNPQPEDYTKHCSNPNNEATLDMLVDDDQLNNMPPFSPVLPNGSSYPLMDQLSVDDSDGAINVPLDLTFPSFTSPLSSPPTASWAMPSIQSGLGGPSRSFVTSLPPTVNPTEDDSACNVAGWIDEERFHPDFLLQAVKPYAEVEADIKRAMRMEPTPPLNSQTPWSEGDNSPGSEKWITVSEVLIADTKRLQIKRLRLRRRVKRPAGCMITPQPCHYQKFLQPDGILTPTPSVDDEDLEDDEFEEEIVCDVDDTLATAIEKVISGEDQASFGCRSTVLGALERVVGDVVNGEPSERWGGNVLTEGVGKWICGVDEAA